MSPRKIKYTHINEAATRLKRPESAAESSSLESAYNSEAKKCTTTFVSLMSSRKPILKKDCYFDNSIWYNVVVHSSLDKVFDRFKFTYLQWRSEDKMCIRDRFIRVLVTTQPHSMCSISLLRNQAAGLCLFCLVCLAL